MDIETKVDSRATTVKAPYIYKSGAWVDANTSLDIRDSDSLSSPQNSKVPVVYARTASAWEQIYPPQEQPGGGTTASSTQLICWQGSKYDKSVWGWAWDDGTTNGWTAAEGFFGDGSYSWENNIHKEFAGWTGITISSLKAAGYKGIGDGKVKKVTKVTFMTNHKSGTGYTGHARNIGLVFSNVASPITGRPGTADINNPTIQANTSSILWSDNCEAINGNTGSGDTETNYWDTWTFNSTASLDLFKKFLNGTWSNIIMFNGHNPSNYDTYLSDGSGGNRALFMTKDYLKAKAVKIQIEYTYEP